MDTEILDSSNTNRLRGKKKKKLFVKIKSQIEFYFSDSNLAKDNFLRKLIEENSDGYVDLEVFKTFNKIKELTDDVEIIAAAISKSDKLQLDGSSTKIKRIVPLGEPKDFDACTAYVEKLPPYADHKWIKDVFEHFGTVDYVNIPRFKTSNKIKGFAFIEFSDPESVSKACEYYQNLLLKESSKLEESVESKTDSGKKHRRRTTSREYCEERNRKRKHSSDLDVTPKKKCDNRHTKVESACEGEKSDNDSVEKFNTPRKKRKADEDICQETPKKFKESSTPDLETRKLTSKDTNDNNESKDEDHTSFSSVKEENPLEGTISEEEEGGGKSKRKRKHRKRHHSERPLLRVMSKFEWKAYRNKYLSLQRTTMSHLKKQILLQSHELKEQEQGVKVEEPPKKGFNVQPGVIVRITLTDSISDPSGVKEQITSTSMTPVAYVDAKLGHSEIFIRCHNPEDAQSLLKDGKINSIGNVQLLEGAEEEAYKKRIEEERKAKFSVPLTNKKRGRDKIIAKATKLAQQKNKHIYFDD